MTDKIPLFLDEELYNLKQAYDVCLEQSECDIFIRKQNCDDKKMKEESSYFFNDNELQPLELFGSQNIEKGQDISSSVTDDQEYRLCVCNFENVDHQLSQHFKFFQSHEAIESNRCKPCKVSFENWTDVEKCLKQEHFVQCLLCCKRFKRQRSLLADMPIHCEEKCLKCPTCDKVFSVHLEQHNKNLETCTKIKLEDHIYKCPTCHKDFNKRESLSKHVRIHLRDLLKCSHCDFTCSKKVTLKMHVITHEGLRKYKCSKCDFSFKQVGHLKRHKTRFSH